MTEEWTNKAALYDLLSKSLAFPTEELAVTLSSGEYAELAATLIEVNGLFVDTTLLDALAEYSGTENKELTRELRAEHTRLFIGGKRRVVSPYGETWSAEQRGTQPLLFIGDEAVAVEQFMKSCGLGHPADKREPLDHISSELEFLKVLCLMKSNHLQAPDGSDPSDTAYAEFYEKHFISLAAHIAGKVQAETQSALFVLVMDILLSLPKQAL